jgi:hypothetical protein
LNATLFTPLLVVPDRQGPPAAQLCVFDVGTQVVTCIDWETQPWGRLRSIWTTTRKLKRAPLLLRKAYKWVAEQIQRGARAEWPAFVRELEGAWADLPSTEQLRKGQDNDVRRGRL